MVISMTCLGFVCVGGFWLSPPTRRRTIFIFVAIILHSLHTGCQWGLIAWAVWKPRLSSLDSKVGSLWLTLMEFDSVVAYMVIFGYAVTTTTDEATHMYWTVSDHLPLHRIAQLIELVSPVCIQRAGYFRAYIVGGKSLEMAEAESRQRERP